jgi:hypothetical protein
MAEMTEMATMAGKASPQGASRGKISLATIALLACVVVGATFSYNLNGGTGSGVESIVVKERHMASVVAADVTEPSTTNIRRKMSGRERLLESEPEPENEDITKTEVLVDKIAKKLQPVGLRFIDGENEKQEGELETGEIDTHKKGEAEKPTMVPHQFLHLHHMKTGGTSIDRLLRCSMDRLKKEANYSVPYYSIHECSRKRFATCLTDPENMCREKMNDASVMSYCAALKYLGDFGWWNNGNKDNNIKAFTVLRNPIDRVWSMFKFQTKNCYKCMPLKEIYQKLDKGEDTGLDKLCLDQLQNHEVNNLLSTEWPLEVTQLDIENDSEHFDLSSKMVQEAVDNMKNFFTVIGITERLPETASILGTTFPWMHLEGSEKFGTTSECALPHANASPKNNRCGEKNTHWDLPKQPDEETYNLIAQHNGLDLELYEAAVEYFQLQVDALGKGE